MGSYAVQYLNNASACVRACERACVRACVRACARVRVRACVCAIAVADTAAVRYGLCTMAERDIARETPGWKPR
jgi:hypothetical protein